jgi:3-dehydroquinate synthase
MQTLELADYNIHVGNDTWNILNDQVKNSNYSKIVVIVDGNTNEHCLPLFDHNVDFEYEIIKIEAGEIYKDIDTCQYIWHKMMSLQFSRSGLVINLGGGVIGDMGGFCASTFKRGVDFIQMPTTLLSQVDASIGGKLGIDFQQVKNSIGVFNNSKAVYANFDFLKTLPAREIRSGFAEIIKHGLIRSASQWKAIIEIQDLEKIDWSTYLVPSLSIKKEIVEIDPFEKGLRKVLNFGHTIGHAIESHFLETENPLLHGEAIAIGMICESYLSQQVGLSKEELNEIQSFLIRIYGKVDLPTSAFSEMLGIMRQDKKNIGDQINFTLLESAGHGIVNQTATTNQIIEAMHYYNSIAN